MRVFALSALLAALTTGTGYENQSDAEAFEKERKICVDGSPEWLAMTVSDRRLGHIYLTPEEITCAAGCYRAHDGQCHRCQEVCNCSRDVDEGGLGCDFAVCRDSCPNFYITQKLYALESRTKAIEYQLRENNQRIFARNDALSESSMGLLIGL
jgi:hypothetical protein